MSVRVAKAEKFYFLQIRGVLLWLLRFKEQQFHVKSEHYFEVGSMSGEFICKYFKYLVCTSRYKSFFFQDLHLKYILKIFFKGG